MTKQVTQIKINMPTFVKRAKKTWATNKAKVSARGVYKQGKCVCIIGAGLTPKQLAIISRKGWNKTPIEQLIVDNVVVVDSKYVKRLDALQEVFDNDYITPREKNEAIRLKLRHLEASVSR